MNLLYLHLKCSNRRVRRLKHSIHCVRLLDKNLLKANPNIVESEIISAARDLVETVLAEAGKEYVHIEPNYLIKHSVPSVLSLGRVRSMPTTELRNNTKLAENPKVKIAVDASGLMEFDS